MLSMRRLNSSDSGENPAFDTVSCPPPVAESGDKGIFGYKVIELLCKGLATSTRACISGDPGAIEVYSRLSGKNGKPQLALRDAESMRKEYRLMAMKRVKEDGMLLSEYPELNEDREIVVAAIRSNAGAYKFAGPILRDDDELYHILIASQQTQGKQGNEKYASKRIRRRLNPYED